ncbi:uncharacterized protein SPSC_05013 [Sporisorium scitamineum]|uniref:Uncharacterized protein n=1 Tax=Sporisorium scitamineum TaxID=49012 RepID=A0A0F7RWX3_9BASI|nr:hypothetical protein [Sporisorium scitamineum]CDU25179.1 uncharacterized protein SPSC_05013 [Sporisorium scitamineum]
MADLTTYLVLAMIILPPIFRQAQRLVFSVRSARQSGPSQAAVPKFLSEARLTPFASPFSATVSIAASILVLISLRNLIPVRYGLDILIPASAIENLRRSVYTLYTAPSVFTSDHADDGPFHIETFRGGYKPDLFLAYKAPITVPTTTLRSLINDAPSLLPIGFLTHSKQAELQALISRLSSYEGRRMYLLLGSRPLLDCTFCKTTHDHFWYAVPFLFGTYAWRILALGLLTTHPDDSVAVAIRQAASLLIFPRRSSRQVPESNASARAYEADRSSWRTSSLTVLLAMLAVELLIMFEFGHVTAESSRLNHWHTNLHILRQLVFLALVLLVYFFPAPRVPNSFEQSIAHLTSTQQSLQDLMHVSELVDVTHSVVLEDAQLLQWKSSNRQTLDIGIGPDRADKIIQTAESRGGQAASDAIEQARTGIRKVTRHWWQRTELVNQHLDQQQAHPTSSSESHQPSPTQSSPTSSSES